MITFDWKGKQVTWFPEKKNQIIRIPFQKNTRLGDKIEIDKILKKDEEFGQPYLPIKLIAEVVKHGLNKKITIMKYKRKKRYKKKLGHRQPYTEIKILHSESVTS